MGSIQDSAGSKHLRIGIDVGGTNTDGVILDLTRAQEADKGILAWHKSATTTNPSIGIANAITSMLESTTISPDDVASITIGTTHFVNAVVERDARRLSRVAVLRLAGPFGKHAPPCGDWPNDLRNMVLGYWASVKGGLEVDGALINDLDDDEIRSRCLEIKSQGIKNVVINGVFSPIDTIERQEQRAAALVKAEIPGCQVVCSAEVANLGFLERENAAILNAAILNFASKTIKSFHEPVRKLGLQCPVFITQNDGTILSGEVAARLPIRTFSSGPTNSMRGAAFLIQEALDESMMVVDIGGTTTDVGLLMATGYPRQQAAYSELAGIRMNFSCPDIKSIGLGGGSIVRRKEGQINIGPDSVGYRLVKDAVVYGGNVLTTTDCTVLSDPSLNIGNPGLATGVLTTDELADFKRVIKRMLESIIDTMKTSEADLPVVLVGGGAIVAPQELKGASKVIKPQWSQIANAIGAAIARVSVVVDTVKSTESKTTQQLLEDISNTAIEETTKAGAIPSSVRVVEMETFPLQYISNKSRFIVRAAGDFDFSRADIRKDQLAKTEDSEPEMFEDSDSMKKPDVIFEDPKLDTTATIDISTYKPTVKNRVWLVNETDLGWISTGCYILGTGGGGTPYPYMIRLREMLRSGAIVHVVSPHDVPDAASIGCGGSVGSPTVGIEKLEGDEVLESQHELFKICGPAATHMIAMEIGGGNGLQGMIIGANMDLPCVDGDWMGRAYPTKWQTTPVVFNERNPIWPSEAISDGNGNVVIIAKATSDLQSERVIRAALSQLGSKVGAAEAPVTGAELKRWVVEHTISQAWRIGRAVEKARRFNRLENIAETIIGECGGPMAAKVIWKGKIIGVERTLRMGHIYGQCIIESTEVAESQSTSNNTVNPAMKTRELVKIPFKNENIAVLRMPSMGSTEKEKQEDVLAIVPDLISVIDSQNGEAIGTPEYRYGLLVEVLGITASTKWTGTQRGIDLGGPKGFGLDHLTYQPMGIFSKPVSVIDEFYQT